MRGDRRRLSPADHGSAGAPRTSALSTAAHPGFTQTDLQRHNTIFRLGVGLWSNDSQQGALPTLYAATAPETDPGGFYGPHGFYEVKGYPAPAKVVRRARDERTATRLWQVGEEVTGVSYLSDGGEPRGGSRSDIAASAFGKV